MMYFKLNIVQQTTFLNKILVSIGGIINIFGKDLTKKKMNLVKKWNGLVSDNSKIIKVDKNCIATVIGIGDDTIFLKEKNSQKIITFTRIMVRKKSRIEFDKNKMPKLINDIKKCGVEYIGEYKVPIILYSNDDEVFTSNENDKLNIINQKIKIKCESDYPNYVKVDEINKDNGYECSFVKEKKNLVILKTKKIKKKKLKDITIQLTIKIITKIKMLFKKVFLFLVHSK